ncbi:hypothetical protein OG440_00755 [Streptomyces sp. NBC_00637]|uniref:MmyB family transcriptional regulator n=1 Tax=Streptomyces sp. NBC_00637 TaxID=2903667 RepID=UPI003245B6C9
MATVDWKAAAVTTVALMRAEAGREPRDRALRDLIGEPSTLSTQFRPTGPPQTCSRCSPQRLPG